jgi:hypothetical protein
MDRGTLERRRLRGLAARIRNWRRVRHIEAMEIQTRLPAMTCGNASLVVRPCLTNGVSGDQGIMPNQLKISSVIR